MDAISLIVNALKDHEQIMDKLTQQLEVIVEKLKSKEEA